MTRFTAPGCAGLGFVSTSAKFGVYFALAGGKITDA